jgi:hypothetical protein
MAQSERLLRSWLPECLRDWLRHTALTRRLKAIDDRYSPQLDAAKTESERHNIRHHWFSESDYWDGELVRLQSKLLQRRACRWDVDIPHELLESEPTEDGGFYVFIGRDNQPRVRRLIREARNTQLTFWLTVVGGMIGILTGLVGALTGLIAVWSRNSS